MSISGVDGKLAARTVLSADGDGRDGIILAGQPYATASLLILGFVGITIQSKKQINNWLLIAWLL